MHIVRRDICTQFVNMNNFSVARTIGQINCKWKRRSVVSAFLIWSAPSHHIACRATRKFLARPHLCSIWPRSPAILYYTAARLMLRRQQRISHEWLRIKVLKNEAKATCARALMQLLIADCWCYCLECTLLKREFVHCWYIPDDDLHEDIS